MAEVFVKKGKARPFWFRHPWVFSGAVTFALALFLLGVRPAQLSRPAQHN